MTARSVRSENGEVGGMEALPKVGGWRSGLGYGLRLEIARGVAKGTRE